MAYRRPKAADSEEDDDVVLLDDAVPSRGNTHVRSPRHSPVSEWAFLDSPSSDDRDNSDYESARPARAKKRTASSQSRRQGSPSANRSRNSTPQRPTPQPRSETPDDDFVDSHVSLRRPNRAIFSDGMSLSDLQAQQRELARYSRPGAGMVRKSAPSARSYNHAVGREPVARAKDEDEDEDDDKDDDVDLAYDVPKFAMKSAPSGVHYNHAVSIKPAPTAGYKTAKKPAPTAASKNHANGSVKRQWELEDSSGEDDYDLGLRGSRTATRRLVVESEQDDHDGDSDDDKSDSAMTQKVAMKTAPSAARYNSAATAKRQRAADVDGGVEVVKTVKLPSSRVIKKADVAAPSPPPQRRSSGNDFGLLSEWLSVSELQAQEREWARLQREKRNQGVHHGEKTEYGTRKSARDDIQAQTQGDNQSASSEMSLIEVVELLEDEDEEMSQKGEDDDDDDFMPSSSWSQKSAHKRGSKMKTDVAMKRAHHRKMMAQNSASAVNGALPIVSDTLPKARTAADTVPHWTTWRASAFAVAPTNLLFDWRMDRLSFTSTADRPLSEYDESGELGRKCAIVTSFGKTKQFVLTNDAVGATTTQEDMNSRVTQLLEKWSPHIRQCYERKTDAMVREARGTIRGYLRKLDVHRNQILVSRNRGLVRARRFLDVCPAERAITRQLVRSSMLSPLEECNNLGYTIGRGESFFSEKSILAEAAVVLAPMRQLSRSTTYVGVKASIRVEDNPILRDAPCFGDHDSIDAVAVKNYDSIRKKREESGPSISSGLEHELHEYMLRLVIAECGDAEIVFNSLKQVAGFTQPYTEYAEIKKLHDARRSSAKRIVDVREFLSQVDSIGESNRQISAAWTALSTLTSTLPPFAGGSRVKGALSLSERLSTPFTYFETNLLPQSGGSKKAGPLGLRNTSDYADLSETFRDLFCRMCYKYDCHEHGIEHPMPSRRVDPIYPNTRYAPVLIAKKTDKNTKEEDKTDNHEDAAISDVNASAEEDDSSAETKQKNEDSSVISRPDVLDLAAELSGVESQESVELLSSESSQAARRRSARSQTVASTLATINLESQMAHSSARQRVPRTQRSRSTVKRSKEDESEYLDNSHAMLLSDKVKTFLATDGLCSDDCWKNASSHETKDAPTRPADGGTSVEATSGFNMPNEHVKDRLSAPEIVLLQKLRYTIGDNPCMIAFVLESLPCREVHTYLVGQQQSRPLGQHGCFSPDVSVKKARKRGRTSTALPQNNRELLKRTRHQRLKDTSAFNHEYEPCNHEGICDFGVGCSCMKRDHMCEKACSCSRDCPNRFLGCRCSMGNCRTNACPCFVAMRECNPDLCFTCGATDMPVLIYNPELRRLGALELGICCNVNAQRGLHKKIGVSFSTTHGWGAFAREPIRRGEFIYEYNGAIISHDEAERRGSIYDKMAISFLFDLNEDAVVDAIRSGNKIKFSNHAAVGQKCHARIMRIGGEHRISIWASADIQKGEELFFNYGYHGESAPDWSQVRITGSSKRGEADKQEQHDE